MKKEFDYIICGTGGAGFSLMLHILESELRDKKILLIDKDVKNQNDRTWCFWEEGNGRYDHLLSQSWSSLKFLNNQHDLDFSIAPFTYKMLRSKAFYDFAFSEAKKNDNVSFIQADIDAIEPKRVTTSEGVFLGTHIFSSIKNFESNEHHDNILSVSQHFGGWFINTEQEIIDDTRATFMDFRIDDQNDCRFGYILPMSKNSALVEIAEFSNNVLSQKNYQMLLKDYLFKYFPKWSYQIEEQEYGIIPMSTYPFWEHNRVGLTYLGLAGGAAKTSTGYAFANIQKQCRTIISQLQKGTSKIDLAPSIRYRWIDRIFMNVLINKRINISDVFGRIFKKGEPEAIMKFLNNQGSISSDLSVMMTCPKLPFTKALLAELF